jgi:Putative transposase
VSGAHPPAGPSFPLRSPGLLAHPGAVAGVRARNTDFERPLCVGRDGSTLHAATRAGGADLAGREALLTYILRPAVAQERIIPGKDGLVRITLKRAFLDGTIAIDVDPLSLLCRLAAAVPYPRFHTVRYNGVLASASKLRPKPRTYVCIPHLFASCPPKRQDAAHIGVGGPFKTHIWF